MNPLHKKVVSNRKESLRKRRTKTPQPRILYYWETELIL